MCICFMVVVVVVVLDMDVRWKDVRRYMLTQMIDDVLIDDGG